MLIDYLKCSVRNLFRKKLRSLLTICSIAIGVGSVVLIASIGEIGKYSISQEISSLGLGSISISSDMKNERAVLGDEQLALLRGTEQVETAVPMMVSYTKVYMRGLVADCIAWGVDSGSKQIINLIPVYGRIFNKGDIAAKEKICLVDQNTAKLFYKRENIVGKKLRVTVGGVNEEFEVVGIVKSGGAMLQGIISDIVPSFVYIPYSTLQKLSGKKNFDQIAVKLSDTADADLIRKQLTKQLDDYAGTTSGYRSENINKQKDSFNRIVNIITLVLAVIASISLLVAGLGIMTIMLVSVGERTREIGIKKSIGANRTIIMIEFLIEALVITTIGSGFGLLGSLGLLGAACLALKLPFVINSFLVGLCIIFSLITGVLFGVYPAYVAANLRPVDALRYE